MAESTAISPFIRLPFGAASLHYQRQAVISYNLADGFFFPPHIKVTIYLAGIVGKFRVRCDVLQEGGYGTQWQANIQHQSKQTYIRHSVCERHALTFATKQGDDLPSHAVCVCVCMRCNRIHWHWLWHANLEVFLWVFVVSHFSIALFERTALGIQHIVVRGTL